MRETNDKISIKAPIIFDIIQDTPNGPIRRYTADIVETHIDSCEASEATAKYSICTTQIYHEHNDELFILYPVNITQENFTGITVNELCNAAYEGKQKHNPFYNFWKYMLTPLKDVSDGVQHISTSLGEDDLLLHGTLNPDSILSSNREAATLIMHSISGNHLFIGGRLYTKSAAPFYIRVGQKVLIKRYRKYDPTDTTTFLPEDLDHFLKANPELTDDSFPDGKIVCLDTQS